MGFPVRCVVRPSCAATCPPQLRPCHTYALNEMFTPRPPSPGTHAIGLVDVVRDRVAFGFPNQESLGTSAGSYRTATPATARPAKHGTQPIML